MTGSASIMSKPKSAVIGVSAPRYIATLGVLQQDLSQTISLPAPTLHSDGWSPVLTGTAGDDVFDPGTNPGGTATMIGNGGNDVFYVHGFNDVVIAKAGGSNTVITDFGWGAYTLPANVQNLVYYGKASYDTGWITLAGNALNNTIIADNSGVALVAGAGNDTLVGGTGADRFIISAGGDATIINFHGGSASTGDTVQVQGAGFSSFDAVQAGLRQDGANAVLSLGGGRTLTFVNQSASNLTAAEFGLPAGSPGSSSPAPVIAANPALTASPALGIVNQPIALSVASALVNPDPGETLTITISGVPAGAAFNAGSRAADGNWSLTTAQLAGLTLTLPTASTIPVNLTVTATATEPNGSAATTVRNLAVTAGPVATAPNLVLGQAVSQPDGTFSLPITAALNTPDIGETLSIRVTGTPSTSTLSAGSLNQDGSWSLTAAQLTGLTVKPASGPASFTLLVTATAAEADGSVATSSGSVSVKTTVTPAYTIMIGGASESLQSPLKLPGATLSSTGWSPTLTGGSGNDVFDPGLNQGGTAHMIGNGGNDVFYVHGSNNLVAAQAGGINTIVTDFGWGSYTLPDNVQNLVYDGAASYQNGWISLVGNALDDTIVANALGVDLIAGAGNDTLVGGAGPDTFVIGAGGNETIINFHGGVGADRDTVQLQGLGFADFASVQAAMHQLGDNTVLNVSNGRTITFVDQQASGFTAAEFGFANAAVSPPATAPVGTPPVATSPTTPTTPTPPITPPTPVAPAAPVLGSMVYGPTIVQPTASGQVVGILLRNNGAAAIASRIVSFGQAFVEGAVPGRQLVATINGQQVAVQMDVRTVYADGSVATAVLTLQQPALAANASAQALLSVAPGAAPQTQAISLSQMTSAQYDVVVTLAIHGAATPYTLDVGSLLQQALTAGHVTYLMTGPQVTEGRFDVPISGSLHLVFDVSRFADGSTATDVSFNNDIAMSASGGTITYDATITQNNAVILQQSNITQYQYQTWHQEVYSNGAPQAQVVLDIAALEKTGAIANYDLTAGVTTAQLTADASRLGGPTYGILGSASVTQYMPTTGGRDDIGIQPEWNTAWLMTQDPSAAAYALAQDNAAGSVPWHYWDVQAGGYIAVTQYPNLWIDPRAESGGYTALTQTPSTDTGWTPDQAHQPDLSYVAYLLTGDEQYLDQLNAQASYAVAAEWPVFREGALDLVGNGQDQVRAQAWNLREVDEAAYANPDNSTMKAYFTGVETSNWHWLVSQIPAWTAAQGQAYGYVPGTYGGTTMAPWEQDYFVSTAVEAAEQGNQDALTFVKWEANFIVGRFLNSAQGFNPQDGIAYNLTVGATAGGSLQTWADIEQASHAAGQTNDGGWAQSQGDYAQLALQSVAGIITLTQSTDAMQAYDWLLASGAPYVNAIAGTQFDIVPRLSDGHLLTADHVIISTDTTATTLSGTNDDQLIHAGIGDDTINGGSGINMLFAGSGNDVLNGGSNADYLFAGSGRDTVSGGGGVNFMKAGSGADTFTLATADVAQDMIASFKVGTDHLQIAGAAPTSSFVAQLLQTMTQDASGSAVLHLSPTNTVTLQGIGATHVNTSLFA